MNRRHDSYEDYCKEINEDEELKAHLADQCDENVCPYCADERNDAELDEQDDIDELVEHVAKEVGCNCWNGHKIRKVDWFTCGCECHAAQIDKEEKK